MSDAPLRPDAPAARTRRCRIAFVLLAAWATSLACTVPAREPTPGPSREPDASGPTAASYLAARALILRGLDSLGPVATAGGLMVQARGTLDQGVEQQGLAPGSRDPVPFSEILAVSPDGGRVAWEYRQERLDGTSEWVREIYRAPEERLILVLEDDFSVLLRSPRHGQARRRISRRLPPVLLREALESPTTLRDLGRHGELRAVAFGLADGTGVTLLLEPDSGLPRRAETLVAMPGLGDSVVGHEWDAYAPIQGGVYPRRYRVTLDDRVYTDMEVETVERGAAAEAFMSRPEGIAPPQQIDLDEEALPTDAARVREVAPGVHVVTGLRTGFHLLFVQTADGIVAVDAPSGYRMLNELPPSDVAPAPSNAWLSERYLELIHEAVPDEPVTTLVLTHFHGDHAGGLRAFVAEGAEIVAAPAAVPGIERLMEAPHTLAPDPLEGSTRRPRIRIVDGALTLGDGDRRIEVIDIGANPHSEHMLVVHLPDHGILYVADLLTAAPLDAFPTPSHAALDRYFVSWLIEHRLAPRRIYTSHGSLTVTPEHLARLEVEAR